MFLHFFYVTYKKEKKNYIVILKTKTNNSIEFHQINDILYKHLYLISSNSINNDNNNNLTFNYFEYFYIKKGLILENQKYIWDKLIKIYLKKINIMNIIDEDFISNLYNTNILLYNCNLYNKEIINFIIEHYSEKYKEDNLNDIINEINKNVPILEDIDNNTDNNTNINTENNIENNN
jgi:hypothetical protein